MNKEIREATEADGVKLIRKTHTLNKIEYQEFSDRCKADGFTASAILRSFIRTYRKQGEK